MSETLSSLPLEELMKQRIANTIASNGLSPERMSVAEKMRIAQILEEEGVLNVKGAVAEIARQLGGVHPHGVPLPEQIPRGLRRKARRKGTAAAFAEGLQTGRRGRGRGSAPGRRALAASPFQTMKKSRDARGAPQASLLLFLPTL